MLIGDQVMKSRAARDLADAVDGAKLVILPGVGHDLPAALWPTLAHLIRGNAERRAPAPVPWIPDARAAMAPETAGGRSSLRPVSAGGTHRIRQLPAAIEMIDTKRTFRPRPHNRPFPDDHPGLFG